MAQSRTFGEVLKTYRQERGLTQEDLAEAAGLSARGISDLERGARRSPREQTLWRLADALGLSDAERVELRCSLEFRRAVSRGWHRRALWPSSRPPGLPIPPTPIIGRAQEVAEVVGLLAQTEVRLVTLTGPGGVGKTRLALEVASVLAPLFVDGVHLVELDSVRDPAAVSSVIAGSLGVIDTGNRSTVEGLKAYLQDRVLLLVLDNYEQIPGAAPLIAELLVAARCLKVLATSRVRLHLAAEHESAVPPLALPHLGIVSRPTLLAQIESVSLFMQRAQAVRSDFELTQENAPAVAELCVRLDGLPLAIELAAARTRLLPPGAMLPRLERRLALLTSGARDLPERQRTLRNTIEWSYELLGTAERNMLARLAVFAGGCTLESVEAVCVGEGETGILEVLGVLADNSLLRQEEGVNGQPRFRMLETVREYALERLEEGGEAATFFSRHTEYYVQLCERAEPEMDGPRQCEWFERLDTERDNVRAAIAWGQVNDIGKAVRLCSALWLWWYTHGYMREGQRWMEAALEARCSLPDRLRLKLLNSAGDLAWSLGNYKRATWLLEEALSLARMSGDRRGITLSLNHLANVALNQGNYERATRLLEESLKLEREDGDRRGMSASLTILGSVALQQGDHDRATQLCEESLELEREDGNLRGIAAALHVLGNAAIHKGECTLATELLEESVALKRRVGNRRGTALSLNALADLALWQSDCHRALELLQESLALAWHIGDRQTIASSLELMGRTSASVGRQATAVRLWGAAESLRAEIHGMVEPTDPRHNRCYPAGATTQVKPAAFQRAWQRGQAVALEETVELCLATDFLRM